MFLTQEPHNIEDFLKSVKFVAPEGMNLKYFIMPLNTANGSFDSLANDAGFEKVKELNVPGVTDTITYKKREVEDRNAMASANFDVAAKPAAYPTHIETPEAPKPEDEVLIHGGQVPSPVRGLLVVESTDTVSDFVIRESVGVFPKNTLFHFTKED
jgi:hypothetical protein